jgi:hypothetical protein
MSKFLTYTHDSGEVVFIRRDGITSFHPRYIGPNSYRVFVTVGPEKHTIKQCNSLEECVTWIHEQIALIEKSVDE